MEESTLDSVQRVFDTWATNGRADSMEQGHAINARRAFERLQVQANQHYLDIGCGNGYSVRWAAEKESTIQAVGIDVSEEMIRYSRKLSENLSNARFIHAPFPVLELKANCFDAIFSMEVLYYLEDLQWGIQNVFRLLKPGGHFVSTIDFYQENPASHSWPDDVGLTMNLLSIQEWKEAFENCGFLVLEQDQLKHPEIPGQEVTWEHTVGSLMTLVQKPA